MEKRPALGKGLSALIPEAPAPRSLHAEVDIDHLVPNTFQPRGRVDDAGLDELAQSIKSNGMIQPIVVRKSGERFEIIAGERRWRAAQRAGLLKVPVVVRDVAPGQERSLLEIALIENIQRENLNPIDEALAYHRLADEFHLTQEAIATAVGKDRTTVANFVRLLRLPEEVRAEVVAGGLSMGHARALLALTNEADQRHTAREIVTRQLSVRETEALVKKSPRVHSREQSPRPRRWTSTRAPRRTGSALRWGLASGLCGGAFADESRIDFGSEDELIRLYDQLTSRE